MHRSVIARTFSGYYESQRDPVEFRLRNPPDGCISGSKSMRFSLKCRGKLR
jgi:hypothetical protein